MQALTLTLIICLGLFSNYPWLDGTMILNPKSNCSTGTSIKFGPRRGLNKKVFNDPKIGVVEATIGKPKKY